TSQPVTFSLSALPAGVTANAFTPSATCTPVAAHRCSVSVSFSDASTAATGSFVITVTGTASGGLVRTTTFTLTVVATTFNYSLVVSPNAATVSLSSTTQTTTATVTATLTAGVSTSVTLVATVTGPSTLVTATFLPT